MYTIDVLDSVLFNVLLHEYPLGTDEFGRCIFSRVIYGTRISLGIGILVVAATSIAGTSLGLLSGYKGGLFDEILMRGVDVMLAFPNIILALMIAGLLGAGVLSVVLSLSLTQWPVYARLVRGQVLSLKKRDFVEAARALRPSNIYIMRVFPELNHFSFNCSPLASGKVGDVPEFGLSCRWYEIPTSNSNGFIQFFYRSILVKLNLEPAIVLSYNNAPKEITLSLFKLRQFGIFPFGKLYNSCFIPQ